MDSLITAAARSLAVGDPLLALNRIALRDDAPALALRGIAMAQLGDLVRAKDLLKRAARTFGPKDSVARARCVVAEAEIALVSRDLAWPAKALDAARATLERRRPRRMPRMRGDLEVRRLLLIGRLEEAEHGLLNSIPSAPARVESRLRACGGGNRDSAPADEDSARCARQGRARGASGGHPRIEAEVESVSLLMSNRRRV